MQGIDIDRSTLAFWVGYAAAELAPLYERLKQHLLASSRLAVDETLVPVRSRSRTHKDRLLLHKQYQCGTYRAGLNHPLNAIAHHAYASSHSSIRAAKRPPPLCQAP
jgi:hypothetical protein